MNNKSILVSGKAKLPQETTAYETMKVLTVIIEVCEVTEEVLDVEFSLVSKKSNDFLKKLLVGHKLDSILGEVKNEIIESFQVFSQGAVIQALESANKRYYANKTRKMIIKNNNNS
ncbi:MAG: hypothetical protein JM58_12205 [Peptococcaceae bacterium BICA1-8]|nr:MAG: hypothetical protein JM58_12205 [Peptococcaceae bacterium BICA1-8]